MKILFVGGEFDRRNGQWTHFASRCANIITKGQNPDFFTFRNSGSLDDLAELLDIVKSYDVIFWWPDIEWGNMEPGSHALLDRIQNPDISADLSLTRKVKELAPDAILVSTIHNSGNMAIVQQIVNRALITGSDFIFEREPQFISPVDSSRIRIFDPMGNIWYNESDMSGAFMTVFNCINQSMDMSGMDIQKAGKKASVPDAGKFMEIIKDCEEAFRLLSDRDGHAMHYLCRTVPAVPMEAKSCHKSSFSFRKDGYVFMGMHDEEGRLLSGKDFIPVFMENGTAFYCGEKEPPVDTPVHWQLYCKLPNINYIIRSCCYVEGAIFTDEYAPYGSLKEADVVQDAIERWIGNMECDRYTVNLPGTGSIVMCGNLDGFENIPYYARPMPDKMFEQ